jgi:hypothetical protein
MSRPSVTLILAALLWTSCGSETTVETAIRPGEGPCDQGLNLTIEGQQWFLPLSVLPHAPNVSQAIALAELLPASVLQPYSFSGKFTTDQLRKLYDLRLTGSATVTLSPEATVGSLLLLERRAVSPVSGTDVQQVCKVEALRRMLVTRGMSSKPVHIVDLPTQPYTEKGAQVSAVSLQDIVDASGLLGSDRRTQLDYRLVAIDETDRASAVRFPWSHGHGEKLVWVPSAAATRSLDTTGDLKGPAGTAIYTGVAGAGWSKVKHLLEVIVAGAGWSKVKHLLEVIVEAAPDPVHTVQSAKGSLTDPASCVGCHLEAGKVDIPVTCTQCHTP